MEADVGVEGEDHEEDHGRVEEDQARLGNVRIVCEPTISVFCLRERAGER